MKKLLFYFLFVILFVAKNSVSALDLNDHEQHQNDKIEVLEDLFADLRDQIEKLNEKVDQDSSKIDDLNKKLDASEEKAMSLENRIVELKTEKEIKIDALTERLIKLEEKLNDSNQNVSQLLTEIKTHVEQQKQQQNKTFIESEHLTNRLNQLEESFHVSNEYQIQQIAELKSKHEKDVLDLQQKSELNASNITKSKEIIESLENQMSSLNESIQNQIEKITQLENKHNHFVLEWGTEKQNQNKTFIEKMKSINEKLSSISNEMNMLNDKLDNNYINKTTTEPTATTVKKRQSYSLSHDISINKMKSQGYQVVYDFPYSHFTTFSEMNSIKSQCSSETILCAGGVASNNKDNLLLVSCGNCHSVLTQTPQNQPVLNNGAYWYMTDTFSFGFSPSNIIIQSNCDYYDNTDNKRLCWHLQGYSGGWRLGKLVSIYTSDYHKIILLS